MDQKTIDTYNQMAKEYDDETIDFWDRFPRTFIDKFISLVSGKVLDIGSGPGRDGLILKENGIEIICLDASAEMVKLSSAKGLESVLGDLTKIPFDDKSFAGVWSYTSLLHIPKKEIKTALEEVHRILIPNGIFGLGLIEGSTEEYRETAGVTRPRWFSFYEKEEVEKLLKSNGFEILYFESFKPSKKNYLNFISRKL